jgi:hypothetical protein
VSTVIPLLPLFLPAAFFLILARRNMSTDLLTTKKAVKYLTEAGFQVSMPTLDRYRGNKIGPRYIRIAKRIFYSQDALDDFLSGTEIHPSGASPMREKVSV